MLIWKKRQITRDVPPGAGQLCARQGALGGSVSVNTFIVDSAPSGDLNVTDYYKWRLINQCTAAFYSTELHTQHISLLSKSNFMESISKRVPLQLVCDASSKTVDQYSTFVSDS